MSLHGHLLRRTMPSPIWKASHILFIIMLISMAAGSWGSARVVLAAPGDCNVVPATVPSGLTNMGFETGNLTGWRTGTVVDYVGVTSTDSFTAPYEGSYMGRIGTPNFSGQTPGSNELCQDFVVSSATEAFVYNIFTYDYQGFDHFSFKVTVTDPATGEILAAYNQGAWGSGTNLKTTGWKHVTLDLSSHVGQTVRLYFNAGGTSDTLYNFWVYLDSAESGPPPVVAPLGEVESATGSVMTDPQTGQVTIAMPFGNKSDITIVSPVSCPGGGAPSSVVLIFGSTSYPMVQTSPGSGTYFTTIPASQVQSGTLSIQATCPNGVFVNTIGKIQLYDPSGYITDAVTGNPIEGASVTLYNVPGWTAKQFPGDATPNTCESNLSKEPDAPWSQPAPVALGVVANYYADPPIMNPQVNPFITNSAGYYGWDVAAGCWFVVVEADGYQTLISPVVGVPPEVTDLDLALTPVASDNTPPIITSNVVGTPGNNGWYVNDVTVSWNVTDPESAISSQTGCDAVVINADTIGTTITCEATSAGGTASASVTIKRDATKPSLNPSVAPNPVLLNGSATATAGAADNLSGIASQSCDAVNTSSVGAKSISCSATDNAGNSNTASANYRVAYDFIGFTSPVDNNGVLNVARAGQALPLKWRLLDAGGNPVTTLGSVKITAQNLTCDLGATADQVEEYAAGSSGLQNLGDGYYQFNWKTPSTYAKSCKTMHLDLGEGATRTALFRFTK
jgi:hypothetical protein